MNRLDYLALRKELCFTPRSREFYLQVAQDSLIFSLALTALSQGGVTGYIASQILLAGLYFRSFSMMHDAVHGALHRNRKLNDWFGVAYGGLSFLPFLTWKKMHLEHHRWAGNPDRDPVMKIVKEFPGLSSRRKRWQNFFWRNWIPLMAFLQQVVFWSVSCAYLKSRKIDSSQQPQLLLSLVAPLFFLIILCISGWLLRGSFFANLPSVLGYLALVEAVNFPHHLGLPRISGERSLMLWQQYKVSRTCIYRSWFCKYVLLNFNYHSEHHMFPSLPWRELPRAYRLVQEMRPSDYNSHNGHVWILQNRRLDLTDVIGSTSLPEFIENKAEIAA